MDDEDILRLQARIVRVSLHPNHAELVLSAELDDDVLIIAQAAGRECALALQLVPAPAL